MNTPQGKDRLAGKAVIVTGAGSQGPGFGTGKAMSVLFAREGASICLVDIDADRAAETLGLIESEGGEAFVVRADVSDESDCARVIATARERLGGVDVLVNNAAIIGPEGPISSIEADQWDRVFAINLKGTMLMSKHVFPAMGERGGGSIVNLASTATIMSSGTISAYGAAKAGIVRFTADLAVGYGRSGIRANAIAPGMILTPMVGASSMSAEARAKRAQTTALGTEGDAWDVARTALFLASDEARWITGVCIPVDGGMTQMNPHVTHRYLSE